MTSQCCHGWITEQAYWAQSLCKKRPLEFPVRKSIKWLQRKSQQKDAKTTAKKCKRPRRHTKQPQREANQPQINVKRPKRDTKRGPWITFCIFSLSVSCSYVGGVGAFYLFVPRAPLFPDLLVSVVCTSLFHESFVPPLWHSLLTFGLLCISDLMILFLPPSSLALSPAALSSRRLAYRMKMGTLPNPKSPKKPVCKFSASQDSTASPALFHNYTLPPAASFTISSPFSTYVLSHCRCRIIISPLDKCSNGWHLLTFFW